MWTYCTHRLEWQAKRTLERKGYLDNPPCKPGARRLTEGNMAQTMQFALTTTVAISAETARLQRRATSSCDADSNAPRDCLRSERTVILNANPAVARCARPNVRRKGRPQVGAARLWASP
jgi:hypothetical protein